LPSWITGAVETDTDPKEAAEMTRMKKNGKAWARNVPFLATRQTAVIA
jgi:hypothetical protein